jgi:hypothetical protein
MMTRLLQLLGVDVGPDTRVVGTELLLRTGGAPGWVAVLGLLLVVLAAGTVLLYRREVTDTPRWKRWTMAGLRIGVLGLLLLMLLRPALRVTIEGDVRRQVILLLDASQSMSLRDSRSDEDDLRRAAIALGRLDAGQELPLAGRDALTDVSRAELVRSALTQERLALLRRLEERYDVRVLTFGRGVEGAAEGEFKETTEGAGIEGGASVAESAVMALRATAPLTGLGDAVRDVLSRSRGQPVAGLVVATDGASNTGVSPLAAANQAAAVGVPLFVYGVGLTQPKDIAVAQIFAPEVSFADDEVEATVRVRTTGLSGQTAVLQLKLGDEQVVREEFAVGGDGEVSVPVRFTPKTPGEYTLSAEAEVVPGEVARDNNLLTAPLRVVDGKIKVLYIETQPRWEYKYLQALMLRDRRLEPKFLLLEASPSLAGGENSPYLARFPASREELFKFDLVILGDVDPRAFSAEQLSWMQQHVTRFGAGMVFLAGRQRMPWLWTGTPMEKLLPVEWDPAQAARPGGRRDAPADDDGIRLELTPAGRLSTLLRLAETEADSSKVWSELPEVFWTARVLRARPAAEVLVVDPDAAKASRFGKMPVMAVQQSGVGTTLFIGTDNLWRFRRNRGDTYHSLIWGQIIQRLALPHLLGESKRTQLSADRRAYSAGQTATLYARLYSTTYEPIALPAVRGALRPAAGSTRSAGGGAGEVSVLLRPVPDQPGMYRAEVVIPSPGMWRFSVDTDDSSHLEIEASESKIEMSETAMNAPLLRDMARVSGGAFVREEELHMLPDLLAKTTDRVRSFREAEIWSSPMYFLLLLGLLTAEWLMRKGAMLK